MEVNYGVNKPLFKNGRKAGHMSKNGKLHLPQYSDADFDNEDVCREIRQIIIDKNPGWSIIGYALVRDKKEA